MTKRVHVFYRGRVQGVGFRYTVKQMAMGFEVTGFVKNLPDGRVELIAEGEEKELEGLLREIEQSHLASFIRHQEAVWSEGRGEFRQFTIAF